MLIVQGCETLNVALVVTALGVLAVLVIKPPPQIVVVEFQEACSVPTFAETVSAAPAHWNSKNDAIILLLSCVVVLTLVGVVEVVVLFMFWLNPKDPTLKASIKIKPKRAGQFVRQVTVRVAFDSAFPIPTPVENIDTVWPRLPPPLWK